MTTPDTIVLIHGFWVTPRSWEHWKSRYEAKGFTVHTPAYPGFEVEVEALRADPTPIADLTIEAIVSHLEAFLGTLDTKPILMGHSAGGAFMQVVMDHGYGCAGVGTQLGADRGRAGTPWTQLHSVFPVLKNPANHHRAVGFDLEQWTYAFTNTYTPEESLAFYERYHIPASGRVLFDSVLANFKPGHQGAWVDFKNPNRAPLLFLSGSEDHIMPPSVQASNAKHYKGEGTITEHDTYDGRPHLMVAGPGWEEIADRALEWALATRGVDAGAGRDLSGVDLTLTHIGGPTTLIEAEGWRILTDPTFDAPGRTYRFGWGTSSRKTTGPAIPAAELGPIDAVLLTHEHHADNLDDAGRRLLPDAEVVLTTGRAPRRLGPDARGLEDWATTRLEAPRPAGAHRHGDAVPPRSPRAATASSVTSSGSPSHGRTNSTVPCGSRVTPSSTTASARSPTGRCRDRDPAPRRASASGSPDRSRTRWTARRARAVPPARPARGAGPLRGLVPLPPGPQHHRSTSPISARDR